MENQNLSQIQTPFLFNNGHVAKNRIVLAPMTNSQSHDDGTLSDQELGWLRLRAEGGFGTLITAGTATSGNALTYPGQLSTYSDRHIPGLRKFSQMADEFNALSIVQLMPPGSRAPAALNGGRQPAAPSEVHLGFSHFEVPRELTEFEIVKIKKDVVASAVRAYQAGATGVEIHAANGYLFTQFFSRATNKREDAWGGTREKRARFLLETLREVREATPPEFVLGVRLLAEDSIIQKGFDIDDTLDLIDRMNKIPFTYLHLSAGNALATSWKYPLDTRTNLSRIRRALRSDVALIASGAIATAEDAKRALEAGADLVALGKVAIAAPDWPEQIAAADYRGPVFPLTVAQLAERGVTEPFIKFLRQMKSGIVA